MSEIYTPTDHPKIATAVRASQLSRAAYEEMVTLLEQIVTYASDVLSVGGGAILLYDAAEDVLVATNGVGDAADQLGQVMARGEGVAGVAFARNETVIINDYHSWDNARSLNDGPIPAAGMAVPLRWQGETVGVLAMARYTDDPFTAYNRYLGELFASQMGIIIGNARLSKAERLSREQFEALTQATQAVTAELDPNKVMQSIMENAAKVLPIISASLAVWEDGKPSMHAHYQLTALQQAEFEEHDLFKGPAVDRILETAKPLIIDDVQNSAIWTHTPGDTPILSWMGLPLQTGERVIGVLSLDAGEVGAFTESHMEIGQALANHTAIALEKATLYAAEKTSAKRMEALLEITQALTQQLEQDALFEVIMDNIGKVIDYVTASLFIYEGTRTRFIAFRGYEDLSEEEQAALYELDLKDNTILQRLRETKQPITIDDVTTHPEWQVVEGGERILSYMAIPLLLRGKVIGALQLDGDRVGQFGKEEVEFGRAFAAQTAIALENARLFEQTRTNLRETELLNTLSQSLIAAPDMKTMLHIFAQPFLNSESKNCIVTLAEASRVGNELHLHIIEQTTNDPNHRPAIGSRLRIPANDYVREREVTFVPDILRSRDEMPEVIATLEAMSVRSLVLIPLRVRDELNGIIAVTWSTPRTFTEAEGQRLRVMWPQLSTMFENRLLFQQTQRALSKTEYLYAGSRRITSARSPDHLLQAITRMTPFDAFASIFLLVFIRDEQSKTVGLKIEAAAGHTRLTRTYPVGSRLTSEMGLLIDFGRLERPYSIPDLAAYPDFNEHERAVIKAYDLQTGLYVPMTVGDSTLGGVLALSEEAIDIPAAITPQIVTLISQAAIVLQNMRLLAATEDALKTSQLLYGASQAMVEATTMTDTLAAFASHAFDLGATRAMLFTIAPGGTHTLEACSTQGVGASEHTVGDTFMAVAVAPPLEADFYLPITAKQDLPPTFSGAVTAIRIKLGDDAGLVTFEWDAPPNKTNTLHRYYGTLAPHFAALITNSRLLAQTRRARQRFEDVAMSMSDAVWELDINGKFSFIAGGLLDRLTYTADEILALNTRDIIHPDDIDKLLAIVEQGQPFTGFKHRIRNRSGAYFWHEAAGTPIFDGEGRVIGYRGVTRYTHKSELTAQREHLASQIGASLTSVLSLDDLLLRIVTDVQATLGFYHVHIRLEDAKTEELVIKQEAGRDSGGKSARLPRIRLDMAYFFEADAARNLTPVIVNNVRHDPYFIPNPNLPEARSVAALPLFRGERLLGVLTVYDNEVGRFQPSEVMILQNIAAQASIAVENARLYKALESQAAHLEILVRERTMQIAKERERIQTIVENTGEGVLLLNEDGMVEYANQAMADILGLDRDTLTGNVIPLAAYRRLVIHKKHMRGVYTAFANREDWQGRLRFRRPDGSEFDGELKLSVVTNQGDKDINFVVLLRDVTAQMEVERMRKRFVENVSHELRTPVASIKLYEMLLRTGGDEKRDQYLESLQKQVDRLEHLVEDLLDLSGMEQGRMSIKKKPFDLNSVVRDVLGLQRMQAEEMGITLERDLDPAVPRIQADRERMSQVLTNLLANAINYTDNGGTVGIRTWVANEGQQVMVEVWDDGLGIGPEQLPFIFERFYRTKRAKDSGRPGTGLGLAIVKEIVEAHGGSISVDSTLGEGTTFTISLPTR